MSVPAAKQGAEEEAERLLAAAKLNPNDGGPFRSLGYQRAAALDPDDAEAGEALCDLLDAEGKESLELAVCKEAAGKSPLLFDLIHYSVVFLQLAASVGLVVPLTEGLAMVLLGSG